MWSTTVSKMRRYSGHKSERRLLFGRYGFQIRRWTVPFWVTRRHAENARFDSVGKPRRLNARECEGHFLNETACLVCCRPESRDVTKRTEISFNFLLNIFCTVLVFVCQYLLMIFRVSSVRCKMRVVRKQTCFCWPVIIRNHFTIRQRTDSVTSRYPLFKRVYMKTQNKSSLYSQSFVDLLSYFLRTNKLYHLHVYFLLSVSFKAQR